MFDLEHYVFLRSIPRTVITHPQNLQTSVLLLWWCLYFFPNYPTEKIYSLTLLVFYNDTIDEKIQKSEEYKRYRNMFLKSSQELICHVKNVNCLPRSVGCSVFYKTFFSYAVKPQRFVCTENELFPTILKTPSSEMIIRK